MKTLPLLAIFAAPVAFAFTTLNFDIAAPWLFAAGLGGLMVADYADRIRPSRMALEAKPGNKESFRLAA